MKNKPLQLVIIFALSGAFINLVLFVMSLVHQYMLFSLFKGILVFILPAIITIISIARREFNLLNIPFALSIISCVLYQEQFKNITFYVLSIATLSFYFISSLLGYFVKKKNQ